MLGVGIRWQLRFVAGFTSTRSGGDGAGSSRSRHLAVMIVLCRWDGIRNPNDGKTSGQI